MTQYIWRLSEAGPGNLGLAVSDDGLLLGRTPLVERRNGRFVVRGREEIERLLRHGHRYIGEADRLMPGPAGVARALNTVDPCMARVAAVHLRLPDLPSLTARDAMEVEDLLIKYASANWDPEKHPRTGAPPNPGWFAPTGGAVDDDTPRVRVAEDDDSTRRSDASPGIGDDSARARSAQNDADTARSNASSAAGNDWVHLPPGKRIDELGDFLEWLANAKPEDEKAIRTEISRYYIDAGNLYAASVLRDALKQALDPNLDRQARQELLNSIEVFSRYDPADARRTMDLFGQLVLLFGVGALPRLRATGPTIAGTAPAELNPLSNSSATAAEAALAEADAAA
jgi:hypothetical protein